MFFQFKGEHLPRVISRRRKDFLRALVASHAERHKRFNETIYQLEPDIKEAPGGLRDFQVARWIGKILFDIEDFEGFVTEKLVSPREVDQILAAQQFLLSLRNDLHCLTSRNRNVLSHELQAEIASTLGYWDDGTRGVETLMKDYFLRAKLIYGFCESMIRHAFPPKRTHCPVI